VKDGQDLAAAGIDVTDVGYTNDGRVFLRHVRR